MLSLISDLLLICATLGLATWCWFLARRLRKFDAAEPHGEISTPDPTERIEDLNARLDAAALAAVDRAIRIETATARADDRIGRMEMLLSSLEEIEEESIDRMTTDARFANDADSLPSFRATRSADNGGRPGC